MEYQQLKVLTGAVTPAWLTPTATFIALALFEDWIVSVLVMTSLLAHTELIKITKEYPVSHASYIVCFSLAFILYSYRLHQLSAMFFSLLLTIEITEVYPWANKTFLELIPIETVAQRAKVIINAGIKRVDFLICALSFAISIYNRNYIQSLVHAALIYASVNTECQARLQSFIAPHTAPVPEPTTRTVPVNPINFERYRQIDAKTRNAIIDLKALVTCPINYEIPINPVICKHCSSVFDIDAIKTHVRSSATLAKCPVCRATVIENSFIQNRIVTNLAKTLREL